MILRSHRRPDGRVVTLSRDARGYRVETTDDGHRVRALDLAPRSRDLAFDYFLTWASASGDLGELYPEILRAVAAAGGTRSAADGVLGPTHRANEEGCAKVARALARLAAKVRSPRIEALAARVQALHDAAVAALPEAVRAPLGDESEVHS